MSETNTVSPLRQRMIEDMAARKLDPHTQRGERDRVSAAGARRSADWVPRIASKAMQRAVGMHS